jgi:uncharacterized protein YeaO (DUF488 family)
MTVKLKRAYESPSADDGARYLVERLWPRGVKKDELALTAWLKELAPSTELRKWFNHRADRWPEFVQRYEVELLAPEKQGLLLSLLDRARTDDVTLVFSTRKTELSGARVLEDVLSRMAPQSA